MADKSKKQKKKRKIVQLLATVISNGHLSGFVTGQIYSGPLKRFCVPGMNCYSCPGALGACPIGATQAVLGAKSPKFAFYVIGYLSLIGVFVGRFICGWLCPFGLVQELIHKIPVKKITVPEKLDKWLRKLKYVFLLVFVLLLPIILKDEFGLSSPYFCKWLCPVGMLDGGIPLLILNEALRPAAHFLYAWKLLILIVIILLSVVINRPFCKYMCPLGAFYGLFHRFSFMQLQCDKVTCIECGACAKICEMQVDPTKNSCSAECIRCGECVSACPVGALKFTFMGRESNVGTLKELGTNNIEQMESSNN